MTAKEKLEKARAHDYVASKAFNAWLLIVDILYDIGDSDVMDEDSTKDLKTAQEILDRLYNKNKSAGEELYREICGFKDTPRRDPREGLT